MTTIGDGIPPRRSPVGNFAAYLAVDCIHLPINGRFTLEDLV